MTVPLAIAFGLVVGFALGLTGGGGSIFAVPLLVYGLGVEPRQAVGVSLASVGTTALIGALGRLRSGDVEVGTGLIFCVGGILGAPVGSWIAASIPGSVLMALFGGLMLLVAGLMFRPRPIPLPAPTAAETVSPARTAPARRVPLLMAVGLLTGVLAGLFGVGGGFLIVPALVLLGGLNMRQAVATSLLAIALISASGVASYVLAGRPLPLDVTILFIVGGAVGMAVGTRLGGHLSEHFLRRTFATALVVVAAFVVVGAAT
jgi:uncharacterized membrane protein YfcA